MRKGAVPVSATMADAAAGGAGGSSAGPASAAPQTASLASSASPLGDLNTLDEPVADTIKRDLNAIKGKLLYVMRPPAFHRSARGDGLRRSWDLWGPLFLCLALSTILGVGASGGKAPQAFALVFVVVWAGSGVVTLNSLLLKGRISFFQSVCVLGYCIFPLVLAAFATICVLGPLLGPHTGDSYARSGAAPGSGPMTDLGGGVTTNDAYWSNKGINDQKEVGVTGSSSTLYLLTKLATVGIAFAWSISASVGFMEDVVPADRKTLAVYPVWLFYASIAWMILLA